MTFPFKSAWPISKMPCTKTKKFRNALKGMIIGHFTVDEYKDYTAYSSSLNKRMMNMAVECLKNQVEYFQPLKEKKVL